MERNYYMRFNPKKYEQHLSPFGNKVLSALMKQWDKACLQNNNDYQHIQHRQFPTQNKRMLTFIDDTVVDSPVTLPPPLILHTACEHIYLEEKSFNFILTDKTVSEIPKSVELISTIPKNSDIDYFLHPAIAANENLVHNLYNKDSDHDTSFVEESEETHTKSTNTGTSKNKNRSEDIHNWDDMLDFELFVNNMNANEEENKDTCVDKIFDITFRNKNISMTKIITNGNKNNMTKSEKRKNEKINESNNYKAKKVRTDSNLGENKQILKESDMLPNEKNNFRKQKYTKAVKHWLNNVEPHHPVAEDLGNVVSTKDIEHNTSRDTGKSDAENIDQNTYTCIHAPLNKTLITHCENIFIDKTLKTTKKVIQAQLANKDGVMKFSKPKRNGEETKKCADVLENKAKDSKDKKVKKFVAPIKSQMYEILTIDEDNIANFQESLREIKNNEIIAVLIYSNGFCQLNSHHTDGTCAPDGVIINNDDMFYCFKSSHWSFQKHKETLKNLLENNKVVCYGARSVLIYLATHLHMQINSINMYDAKIGASLLDPDNSPENFTDLQKMLSFTAPFTIATECILQKCAWHMSLLKECWTKLHAKLVEDSLWNVFVEIEMKLLPIIADMERRGVCIDMVKLNAMEQVLLTRMKSVEQQCYKAAGKVFQINSAVQVRAIIYDELQLDTKCNVKIRETLCKGAKSTSETMLRSLVSEHPLPKLILEYRHLHKAHATFLTGIAQHVKDGVVRPTWVQTAAATGRIASMNPNLQAIPKAPFNLVMFPDAGDDVVIADTSQLMFRSVYVPRAGRSLLAADFQHVECRVFAHVARDASLLRALAGSADLFKVLAAQWLKKPEADIVAEERERTKRLVYASLYGAGTRKLMEILHTDYQQALQVAASFNRTFPSLKSFGRDVVSRCGAARGRLATLCGRVRRFTNINSEDFNLKSHAERQAVNFVVQGSAADLCKTAMILTELQLRSSSPPVDAQLVLQIHDELVWEVEDRQVSRAAAIIKQVMEGCGQLCGMAGSLPVAMSVGPDWASMRPCVP